MDKRVAENQFFFFKKEQLRNGKNKTRFIFRQRIQNMSESASPFMS